MASDIDGGGGSAPLDDATLDSCAREPIHIPGAIQPHGTLIAFEPRDRTIVAVAANSGELLGAERDALLGEPLATVFTPASVAQLLHAIERGPPNDRLQSPHWLRVLRHDGLPLTALVHRFQGVGYIEVEAGGEPTESDWLEAVREMDMALAEQALSDTLGDLLRAAAIRVRRMTHFDRVMIYRFDADWNGEVVEEDREPHLESYAGLHYPASDIPPQARALYASNPIRYIADVGYTPVPIEPALHPRLHVPFDLSHAALRSVSPIHIQYLKNMGVASTLTISLIVDGRLWGLVACHHMTPTRLRVFERHAALLVGVTLSALIGTWQKERLVSASIGRTRHVVAALRQFSDASFSVAAAVDNATFDLLRATQASGGVLWLDEQMHPFGQVPQSTQLAEVLRLARSVLMAQPGGVYTEIALQAAAQRAGLAPDSVPAGGAMAIALGPAASRGLLWLRPELRAVVHWGGDPNKPVETAVRNGQVTLSPRRSFERWREVVAGRCLAWDETDRKAAEAFLPLGHALEARDAIERMVESEQRFRSLVLLSSDAYWESDLEGRITLLSRPIIRGGNGATSIVGTRFWDWPQRLGDEFALQQLRAALAGAAKFRGIELHLVDGATVAWFTVSGEPRYDERGRHVGWRGTIVDVSARRRAAEATQAQQAAEQASAEKTRFLSQMSHELRTPLNAILGFAELLQLDPGAMTPQQRRYVDQIAGAGEHLLALINDLLDLSRLDSDALALEAAPVPLHELVRETVALVQPLAAEAGVTLSPTLPAEVVIARADRRRLKQVVLNLLSNAIKYNRRGGDVQVIVGRPTALRTIVVVRDTGIGMDPQQLNRLFEPFNRLGHEHGKVEGTGIGLTIARRLVERMGGSLTVSSERDVGTEFVVSLPLDGAP